MKTNYYSPEKDICYECEGKDVTYKDALILAKNGKKVKREVYHIDGSSTSLGIIK
jgi:hypothetical protein